MSALLLINRLFICFDLYMLLQSTSILLYPRLKTHLISTKNYWSQGRIQDSQTLLLGTCESPKTHYENFKIICPAMAFTTAHQQCICPYLVSTRLPSKHISASGTNSSRPWSLHWCRCHHECSRHCNCQSVFCCTPSNRQCAAFTDMHHLVDTSPRTYGHKAGLLQLSSLGAFLDNCYNGCSLSSTPPIVSCSRRAITPFFRELHWLKVPERIQFSLCVLAYRRLNDTAPSYLAEILHLTAVVGSRRRVRSASTSTLVISSTWCTMLGDQAFPVAAAWAWNALPLSVHSVPLLLQFCRDLKTSLFQSSYSSP